MWLWFGIVRTLALVKEGLAFVIQKITERQAKRADSKPAEPIGPPSPEALAALEAHVAALRERASQETAQIGSQPPSHPRELLIWEEEWRSACTLLAALADYDRERLRLAAATEVLEPGTRLLLLDATEHCEIVA